MTEPEHSWRGWRAVERNLTPRVDELMRTSQFARGLGLLVDVRALARRQATAATERIWHGLKPPRWQRSRPATVVKSAPWTMSCDG